MEIRHAEIRDIPAIMGLIYDSQKLLRDRHVPQWVGSHAPNEDLFLLDIQIQSAYVMLVDNELVAVATLDQTHQLEYDDLESGEWDGSYDTYISIHRFAVSKTIQGKGMATRFLGELIKHSKYLGYQDIRIDTHPKNNAMQRVILKTGFTYIGDIHLGIEDGERMGFQYIDTPILT